MSSTMALGHLRVLMALITALHDTRVTLGALVSRMPLATSFFSRVVSSTP